jgi:hypothetical protein
VSAVVDEVFDLLANSRRRQMLWHLDAAGKSSLRDLAEIIATDEEGRPIDDLSGDEIRRVYISLYQYHAPKLEEKMVLARDEEDRFRLADNRKTQIALSYLNHTPEVEKNGIISHWLPDTWVVKS